MEKEAFMRCLDNILLTFNLPVAVVSTDRHRSIKSLMHTAKRYQHIDHQFDPWHIAKGLLKNILAISKKKGNLVSYGDADIIH